MHLIVQIDAENDIVYLAFSERTLKRGSVVNSVRVSDDVTLDFNARGVLLGLDVMNASRVLGARPDGTA